MKFIIIETGKRKTITLRQKEENGEWSKDFFSDVSCTLNCHYVRRYHAYMIYKDAFEQMEFFWKSEVEAHNSGKETLIFGDPNGKELLLEVVDE